jgi:hypothetical protein
LIPKKTGRLTVGRNITVQFSRESVKSSQEGRVTSGRETEPAKIPEVLSEQSASEVSS